MNKKNAGPVQANDKKVTKKEGHKPWALEEQTEGLDQEEQVATGAKAEKKDNKKMDADDCGCKYF